MQIPSGKPLYLAMVVRHPTSMHVDDTILGRPIPIRVDTPGLVGFVLAFDNEDAAREWGGGRVLAVETQERTTTPDKPEGG